MSITAKPTPELDKPKAPVLEGNEASHAGSATLASGGWPRYLGGQSGPDGGDDALPRWLKGAPLARSAEDENAGEEASPPEHEARSFASSYAGGTPPPPIRPGRERVPEVPGGAPLHEGARRDLEQHAGASLDHVRVHADPEASRLSKGLSAKAFCVGEHVFFAEGRYQPEHSTGRELIAHEVAHVLQHQGSVARNPDGDPLDAPPDCDVSASLSGLDFMPLGGALFAPNISRERQYMAVVLRKLSPGAYRRAMVDQAISYLRRTGGMFATIHREAEGEEPRMRTLHVAVDVGNRLIRYLEETVGRGQPREVWLNLRPQQIELLELGQEVEQTLRDLRDPAIFDLVLRDFPRWYSGALFLLDAGNFGELLRQVRRQRQDISERQAPREGLTLAQQALFSAIHPAVLVLERLRRESSLFADPVFRGLWRLPAISPDTPADQLTGPGDNQVPEHVAASRFLMFTRTQPALQASVLAGQGGSPPPAVQLFERFTRFFMRTAMLANPADQQLSARPTDRNAPPLPARMSAYPELEPPYFDAALGTDHRFVLDVSFSDIYEALSNAFGGFLYYWEIIEVQNARLSEAERAAGSAPGTGETPGWGDVWGARMRRQGRYALADVERAAFSDEIESQIARVSGILGPPFMGPVAIVTANAALRTVGEVVSTFVDMLTTPRNERLLVLPRAGLWVVRAYCTPSLTNESEFRRAPSMAYVPVYARSAETMGRIRMEQHLGAELQNEISLTEVLLRLEEKQECDAEYGELIQARDALQTELYGTAEDMLRQQERALVARSNERGVSEQDQRIIARQLERIRQQLQVRSRRAGRLRGAERIRAVFVTDLGAVIRPLIEGVATQTGSRFRYYVSDVTTPNAADETGYGTSRGEALQNALVRLFERHTGYGRGELQIFVPSERDPSVGEIVHRRIEASMRALMLESTERITAAVSVAALIAAPFTGGASLGILVPVGIIGAIPSAYRLADRRENGTLRADTQTLLDVVNVVSAGVGACGGLRGVALQRFFAIVGLGTDGLTIMAVSYQTMREIEDLPSDMPEGARRAAVMRIMGTQMQAVGMLAAGRFIGHAYSLEQAGRGRSTEEGRTSPDAPTARGEGAPGVRADVSEPVAVRTRNPTFERQLPADLQGRIIVEQDTSLLGNTMEVRYRTDAFGTIREVLIVHAPGALPEAIPVHATTARQLLALTRFSARVRTLYNRIMGALGGSAPPRPNTEAFNAQFEIPKLREWIRTRQEMVQRGELDAETFNAERDIYEIQLRHYEQIELRFRTTGDAGAQTRGAIGSRAAPEWTRQGLRDQFHISSDTLPVPRPEGWTGTHEAAWLDYPTAEPGYYWRLETQTASPRLVYQSTGRGEGARGPRAYNAATREFVPVREGTSPTTLDAIREGLPPPPEGHHYVRDPNTDWELRLNPGEAERGTRPQELVEDRPGVWRFQDRTEGNLPTIRRQPYRTDVDVGTTIPADFRSTPELRQRYEALLRARDEALRAREEARSRIPEEPDPSNTTEHEAWANRPDVREYLRIRNQVGTASRDLGTFAADVHVRRQWPGARRIHPADNISLTEAGSRPGDFDLVYEIPGGRYVVVEAKGGSSPLGYRRVSGGRERAQQGTQEYFDAVVREMRTQGASARMASERLSGTDRANIIYLHTELQLTTGTGTAGALETAVGGLRVHAFDINQPGVPPAPPETR